MNDWFVNNHDPLICVEQLVEIARNRSGGHCSAWIQPKEPDGKMVWTFLQYFGQFEDSEAREMEVGDFGNFGKLIKQEMRRGTYN